MTTITAPLTTAMLTWSVGDVDGLMGRLAPLVDEPVLGWLMTEAATHDASLAATPGAAIGVMWVPEPESGQVRGAGWMGTAGRGRTKDLVGFMKSVTRVPRAKGWKVVQNLWVPLDTEQHGQAGGHDLVRENAAQGIVEKSLTIWTPVGEEEMVGVSLLWHDDAWSDAAADALGVLYAETLFTEVA